MLLMKSNGIDRVNELVFFGTWRLFMSVAFEGEIRARVLHKWLS
jgi:hypothetical protein